jgi:hypothetical protein
MLVLCAKLRAACKQDYSKPDLFETPDAEPRSKASAKQAANVPGIESVANSVGSALAAFEAQTLPGGDFSDSLAKRKAFAGVRRGRPESVLERFARLRGEMSELEKQLKDQPVPVSHKPVQAPAYSRYVCKQADDVQESEGVPLEELQRELEQMKSQLQSTLDETSFKATLSPELAREFSGDAAEKLITVLQSKAAQTTRSSDVVVCSLVRLFACSLVRLFACSLVRLFACSLVRLFALC